jgi:putative ABC transport system permease protein
MPHLVIITRNLWRNPRRTALSTLSTALSMFVFATLTGFSRSADCVVARTASSLRIAVHNKAGLTYLIPDSYKRKIAELPHVEAVAAQNWFGGIYHDVSDQFANLAVDHDSIERIWPDWGISPIAIREFKRIRIACLVGLVTMKTNHLRVGQQIILRGSDYPINVVLTIVGTLGPRGMSDLLVFRRDYLEQVAGRVGQVSVMWVKVDSPHSVTPVIRAIDETFSNSNHETKSEAEAPFLGSFLSSCQMLMSFARLLCVLVLAAIALVSANTAAMSIRERRVEVAIMRAMGYSRLSLLAMLMVECVMMSTSGGLVGCAAAALICRAVPVMPAFGFVGAIEISPLIMAAGLAASVFTGAIGGLLPAIGAIRGKVVDELRAHG